MLAGDQVLGMYRGRSSIRASQGLSITVWTKTELNFQCKLIQKLNLGKPGLFISLS